MIKGDLAYVGPVIIQVQVGGGGERAMSCKKSQGSSPGLEKNGTTSKPDGMVIDYLRIPDSYDAKIAKICDFWTFWPVIQLIRKYGFSAKL